MSNQTVLQDENVGAWNEASLGLQIEIAYTGVTMAFVLAWLIVQLREQRLRIWIYEQYALIQSANWSRGNKRTSVGMKRQTRDTADGELLVRLRWLMTCAVGCQLVRWVRVCGAVEPWRSMNYWGIFNTNAFVVMALAMLTIQILESVYTSRHLRRPKMSKDQKFGILGASVLVTTNLLWALMVGLDSFVYRNIFYVLLGVCANGIVVVAWKSAIPLHRAIKTSERRAGASKRSSRYRSSGGRTQSGSNHSPLPLDSKGSARSGSLSRATTLAPRLPPRMSSAPTERTRNSADNIVDTPSDDEPDVANETQQRRMSVSRVEESAIFGGGKNIRISILEPSRVGTSQSSDQVVEDSSAELNTNASFRRHSSEPVVSVTSSHPVNPAVADGVAIPSTNAATSSSLHVTSETQNSLSAVGITHGKRRGSDASNSSDVSAFSASAASDLSDGEQQLHPSTSQTPTGAYSGLCCGGAYAEFQSSPIRNILSILLLVSACVPIILVLLIYRVYQGMADSSDQVYSEGSTDDYSVYHPDYLIHLQNLTILLGVTFCRGPIVSVLLPGANALWKAMVPLQLCPTDKSPLMLRLQLVADPSSPAQTEERAGKGAGETPQRSSNCGIELGDTVPPELSRAHAEAHQKTET